MEQLSAADLRGVLAAVQRIETVSGLDTFRTTALAVLGGLVPNESSAYNEIEQATGRVLFLPTPPETGPLLAEPWAVFMHQHPSLAHAMRTRDGSAFKVSDFLTQREFHALDLYDTCFRPLSLEHQISIGPLIGPPLTVGIAMNRGRRDFSERDRALANLLMPHLRAGFLNARARELANAISEWEDAAAGFVLLNAAGSVLAVSAAAERLLSFYFPGEAGDPLPETIRGWLDNQGRRLSGHAEAPQPNGPLVVRGESGRLVVRFLPGTTPTSPLRLLIEERRSGISPDALRTHGLTPRQIEVLSLAAQGYPDKQIAAELSISVRTVRKHFENLYETLGVHGRTAALARATELQDEPGHRG